MANKSLFNTTLAAEKADARNNAGGIAYSLSNEAALAQYVLTGCLNGTFYTTAEDQLETILLYAEAVDDRFLGQLAIYARQKGFMKDTPALLCAILASRNTEMLKEVFPQVIDNGKMVRNFVQIIRSGVTGRKSLGSAPRQLVRNWLNTASEKQLLNASVGQSPSLADVVKMVHPKAVSTEMNAFYAWLIKKDFKRAALPKETKAFETWKSNRTADFPNVPFQMLTAQELSSKDWTQIAKNAGWQMTRMNLNTFLRHGVLSDVKMADTIAKRLKDQTAIKRAKVFPYQLMAAYLNVDKNMPRKITNALQDAMEIAVENVPEISGKVYIAVDISGSMHSSVTGYRQGSTSKVRCIDVASLIAAAILRQNREAVILPFESSVRETRLNPHDSVMTNATKLCKLPAGGTNCSAPLSWINDRKEKVDALIMISDNESWLDNPNYGWYGGGKATKTMDEWLKIKRRSRNAKFVCLDIQPNAHTQAKERKDILNIGGFSDQVFNLIANFCSGKTEAHHLENTIREIPLSVHQEAQAS